MKNYYNILGVKEDASSDQIKKAFKDIAKKEHKEIWSARTGWQFSFPLTGFLW